MTLNELKNLVNEVATSGREREELYLDMLEEYFENKEKFEERVEELKEYIED